MGEDADVWKIQGFFLAEFFLHDGADSGVCG